MIPNGIVKLLTYITLEVIKMEERNKVTSNFKPNVPEELVVFHAASLENEIRFYLTNTQYLTAVECEEGCSIRLEENNKKSKISVIRENLKAYIILFSAILVTTILGITGIMYLSTIIDSILVFLIIMNIIYFIIDIVNAVIIVTLAMTPAIKSKHSAEHMMVNFLKINKRLPKNIEEVKKSSRFSPKCGSRKRIEDVAEKLICGIAASIFTVVVNVIVSHFSSNPVTNAIVLLSTYFLVGFVVRKAITKYGTLNFIIEPIKKVSTNIVQCATTTSKVKDRDIILAYSVAKAWLQVVYPEFYNENEDIFWK